MFSALRYGSYGDTLYWRYTQPAAVIPGSSASPSQPRCCSSACDLVTLVSHPAEQSFRDLLQAGGQHLPKKRQTHEPTHTLSAAGATAYNPLPALYITCLAAACQLLNEWCGVVQVNTTDGMNPTDFISKWVAQRAADASSLGKPLIIEEFGKQLQDFSAASIAETRDPIFSAIYASLQNLDSVKGGSFALVIDQSGVSKFAEGFCTFCHGRSPVAPLCINLKGCSICWHPQHTHFCSTGLLCAYLG